MPNKITTALIALLFTVLMLWFAFSPFLAPHLFIRAYGRRGSFRVTSNADAEVINRSFTEHSFRCSLKLICLARHSRSHLPKRPGIP